MTQILGATPRELDKKSNTVKAILLILAIVVFFPIVYFLIYPSVGGIVSLVIFLVYVVVIAVLIRGWSYKKFGKEEF